MFVETIAEQLRVSVASFFIAMEARSPEKKIVLSLLIKVNLTLIRICF